jgi:hypothetical protein
MRSSAMRARWSPPLAPHSASCCCLLLLTPAAPTTSTSTPAADSCCCPLLLTPAAPTTSTSTAAADSCRAHNVDLDSCLRLLLLFPAAVSCRCLLPLSPAAVSCRCLLPLSPAAVSCRCLLSLSPVAVSCRATTSTPAADSCRAYDRTHDRAHDLDLDFRRCLLPHYDPTHAAASRRRCIGPLTTASTTPDSRRCLMMSLTAPTTTSCCCLPPLTPASAPCRCSPAVSIPPPMPRNANTCCRLRCLSCRRCLLLPPHASSRDLPLPPLGAGADRLALRPQDLPYLTLRLTLRLMLRLTPWRLTLCLATATIPAGVPCASRSCARSILPHHLLRRGPA